MRTRSERSRASVRSLRKRGDVELHHGAGPPVRRCYSLVAARADIMVKPRLAVTENGAGGVPGRGPHRMVKPRAVSGRDQHFGVNAAKSLGKGILYVGRHQASLE